MRHPWDVEFDDLNDDKEVPSFVVNVSVGGHPSRDADLTFDGVLDVPSGTLLIGDADRDDALSIEPARCRVQVWLDDPDHAKNVGIALTSADAG